MKLILIIGAGSFIGGVIRYLISLFVHNKIMSAFPLGTLIVNLLGCFFIGIVFGLIDKGNVNQEWKFFLITGLLGGFTTFSAFSIETVNMLRDGQFLYASSYILFSVVFGIIAAMLGILIIKIV
ncbi:MAG: fluoride efflux transporter CrcB [Bacteroidales bacterium]